MRWLPLISATLFGIAALLFSALPLLFNPLAFSQSTLPMAVLAVPSAVLWGYFAGRRFRDHNPPEDRTAFGLSGVLVTLGSAVTSGLVVSVWFIIDSGAELPEPVLDAINVLFGTVTIGFVFGLVASPLGALVGVVLHALVLRFRSTAV